MADFKLAIPTIFKHEGGYQNDPDDRGGETNYGICKRSYPDLDIARLTADQAEAIYERDYWTPLRLDQFTDQSVATKLFDTAVLIGRSRAVRFLQRAVQAAGGGLVEVDGAIGPKTVTAVNACSPLLLLQSLKQQLATFYEGLVEAVPTDKKFLTGWLTRANS